MATPAPLTLGAAALLLAGALAGGVLGSLLFSTAAPLSVTGGHVDNAELVTAMRALTEQLQQFGARQGIATAAPVVITNRQDAAAIPAPAKTGEARIVELLERISAALATGSGPVRSGGAAPPRITVPPLGDAQRRELLGTYAANSVDTDAASRDFFFMSYQNILDRFGRPDRISEWHGGQQWSYIIKNDEREDEFYFRFLEGFVVSISY